MAAKKKADLKAQKARKQKMILGIGAVLFVIVLAIQAPRILKMVHGGGGEATAAPYKAFPDGGLAGATATQVSVSPTGTTVLPDHDSQPEASAGQLVDFELFSSKDPFAQQVLPPENGDTGGSESGPGPDSAGTGDAGTGGDQQVQDGSQVETPPSSAVISVNGSPERVDVGGQFPSTDPAFVLVSATKSSVRIGIAGGSLATGDDTVTLHRGKTLTLVNTVDGTEYHLRLVSAS